jgi:hypothetical protein
MSRPYGVDNSEAEPDIPDAFLTADEMWAITWRASVLTPDAALEHPFAIEQYRRMFDLVDGLQKATAMLRADNPDGRAPTMPLAELIDRGLGLVPSLRIMGDEEVSENGIDPDFAGARAGLALDAIRDAVLQALGEHQITPYPIRLSHQMI